MTSQDSVFRTERVTKTFGSVRAVDELSFDVTPGEIYGLVGPSGAGKTTLIRMLSGLASPSSGSAWLLGARMPSERRRVEARFGYMPQERAVYRDLTIAENLLFFGRLYSMTRARIKERTRELLELMRLPRQAGQLASSLSGGEKQRLSLACALLHQPAALLLDEPTIGLDPALRREFWDHFHQLNDRGQTILLSTHYLHEAEWCGRVGLVQRGHLVAEGSPDALRAEAAARSDLEHPDMEQVFLILTGATVSGVVA
jgi:ABC-2 type transport system ATP-binding protein